MRGDHVLRNERGEVLANRCGPDDLVPGGVRAADRDSLEASRFDADDGTFLQPRNRVERVCDAAEKRLELRRDGRAAGLE